MVVVAGVVSVAVVFSFVGALKISERKWQVFLIVAFVLFVPGGDCSGLDIYFSSKS